MAIKKYHRNIERLLLACVTAILAVMAFLYYNNIKHTLQKADAGYQKGTVLHLAKPLNKETLVKIFNTGNYFADARYTKFVTDRIAEKIAEQGSIKNLGELNKSLFWVDAVQFANSGSEAGELRMLNSLAHLGMDSALYQQEKTKPVPYPAQVSVHKNTAGISIKGSVNYGDDIENAPPKSGILVKLTEIYPDDYFDTIPQNQQGIQTTFYARTNDDGDYEFKGLNKNGNYSVVPVKPGFEFGAAKGTATITNSKTYNFTAKPHRLRILDATEYRQIKNDDIVTVRTPQQFLQNFVTCLAIFIVAFWMLHITFSLKNYRSDQFILPLLMFITGVGIIVLYSIQNPLLDEIFADGMAKYAAIIVVLFTIYTIIAKENLVNRFYHSAWFDPIHKFLPGKAALKAPRGYTWLLASIILMLLLLFFGTGPQGSGVKVNLFGFQVSELSKFLMIVFFAGYFSANAGYFKNITDNRWLTKNNLWMLGLFMLLLCLYAYLGDLGPAIVLCLTFLFFYSFAKEEFLQMVLAAIVFALLLFIFSKTVNNTTVNYLPWVALACCVTTFVYAFVKKKNESVFFIVVLLSSFVVLEAFPFDFTKRLADRNSMFNNIWENNFIGGDQLAQGVWSLNSGGLTGQGLGNGFSNMMPAYHTDMIMQSIGEEIGIIGLIAIFLAFGLLFYRCILAARRTGKPFLFYLMCGIAIATMVQFMIIVAGTLDLIPLTGISVPFLSKGNAGIIITMFSFLLVLVLSNEKGDALEMDYVKKNFDNVNTYAILTFFGVIIIFTGCLIWYQAKSNTYIVKPALVLNRSGEWQYSYNPRIGKMIREIKPGNIYDRNGILLATSDKNTFTAFKSKLVPIGANVKQYDAQLKSNQKRFYPFNNNLLFWLGDYNREIAKEETNGYAAEYRHFTMLRGFNVNYTTTQRTSERYKENRFLPERTKESELVLYDYSALAPFIKKGSNSQLIQEQNNKPRDIQLSLDVVLNEKINNIIQNNPQFNTSRISVVALNAKNGEVLASASNPAPSYKDLKLISNIDIADYRTIYRQLFNDRMLVPQDLGITFNSRPGSTVKIIDAYAAMNKYGTDAANFSYFIYPEEVIHKGEPENETVNMRTAIVRSSNVYFIKLVNEKGLQMPLFNIYDALGMNIIDRGGYHFNKPRDYDSTVYFKVWDTFLGRGKNIYNSKKLAGSRKRFESNYSNIAWGQGELKATPLHLAKMSGTIANNGVYQPSKFLLKSWTSILQPLPSIKMSNAAGMDATLSSFMKEQSAKVAAATGLDVRGKTGSPERDKIMKRGDRISTKRVTDAWYTFFVPSPKLAAPVAFTIRIEEIGNSEYAKDLAKIILQQLKTAGYF